VNHASQVVRSGAKLLGSQILINLFSIGFTIFLARVLPKADFATFAVFAILSSLIRVTVNFGLEATCIQRVPELIGKGKIAEASAILKTTLLSRTVFSLFVAAFVCMFSAKVCQLFLKTEKYDLIIKIMSLGLLFSSLIDSLGLLSQVTQQFGKISIIQVVIHILSRCSSIALYFLLGLRGYIIGLAWTPIIGVILYMLILRRYLFMRSGFYPWSELVKYSLPFYGRGFIRFGLTQFDQFVVSVFLAPTALATYFVARRIADCILMVSNAIGNPIRIKISELKKEGRGIERRVFGIVSRYYSFVFVPLGFCVASTSYFLLHLYGGYKYTNGAFILILLSLGTVVYSLGSLYSIDILILDKPKGILKLESIGALVNVIFAIVLGRLIGMIGIPMAKLLAFVATLLYGRFLLKRIINAEFDIDALKSSLVASLAMAIVIGGLQLIYYRLEIVPIYILLGLSVFALLFNRGLEGRDIKLLSESLPDRLKGLVKVLYWLGVERPETFQIHFR